jgi:dTDP-4-dehydrorhamnose reductase
VKMAATAVTAAPAATDTAPTFLIFGRTGWIGSSLGELLTEQKKSFVFATSRLEDRAAVAAELDKIKPTYVLNAAGAIGRPNVDWCERNRVATTRINVIGMLNLCELANERGIHLTNFSTGCIYTYDDEHPVGGKPFTEESVPNFDSSIYSLGKAYVERLARDTYPQVLTLRFRLPIGDDLGPRNFITKITRYAKVVNVPNSVTVLSEYLPISIKAAERKLTGVYNFTNPGVISHNEVLTLYKQYIDPSFTWVNFSVEEQNRILACPRSNNHLDVTKLAKEFPEIKDMDIHKSIIGVFQRIKAGIDRQKAAEASASASAPAASAASASATAPAPATAAAPASATASA